MVRFVTAIDFVDGDEPSDDVVQNYKRHLAETVEDATQNLSLRTIKGVRIEKVQVEEIKAEGDLMPRFEPMTLANMRQNGVRAVIASCANCGRSADVYVGHLAREAHRPEAGNQLRCSHCGGKTISTRLAWHTGTHRPVTPDYRRERPPMS